MFFHLPGFSDLWQMSLRFQTASRSARFHLASSLGNFPIRGEKNYLLPSNSKQRAVKDARLHLWHMSLELYPKSVALPLPPLLPILLEDPRPHACSGPPHSTGKTMGWSPMACAPPEISPCTQQGHTRPPTLPPKPYIKENSLTSSKKSSRLAPKQTRGQRMPRSKLPRVGCSWLRRCRHPPQSPTASAHHRVTAPSRPRAPGTRSHHCGHRLVPRLQRGTYTHAQVFPPEF